MGRRWVILSTWILGLLVVTIVPATAQTVLRTPGERPGPLGDLPAALLTPVTVDLQHVALEDALTTLATRGGFALSYSLERMPMTRHVSVTGTQVEVIDILLRVLELSDTELLVTADGQLVLRPVPQKVDTATLSGFVRSRDDGETLPHATVALVEQGLATQSNTEGYYALNGVPSGSHVLSVFYVGHQVFRDTLLVDAGADVRLDIELIRETVQMRETVVEATSGRVEDELRQLTSVVRLPIRSLKELPAVGEPALLRSLHLLPGVQAASDLSSGLYVRGGGPDQTGILLDQVRLYNPSHAFGFFSTFNPDAIKDVTFYKGAYPARYGGSLGAVLDVQNRDGNRREFHTSGGVSLISSRLMTEGPIIGDGSWMVAGRRTYIDPVLKAIRGASEGLSGLGYHFFDLNGKVNTQLTPNDNLMISAYGGDDDLDVAYNSGPDSLAFGMLWGNRALTGRLTHVFSPTLFGRLIAIYSKYESNIGIDIFDTSIAINNQVRDVTIKGDVDYYASPEHSLRTGLDLTFFRFDYGVQFNQFEENLSIEPYLLSAYVQDSWQISALTEARLGLRGSLYEEGSHVALNPRLSVSHHLQDDLRLKLAAGRYEQYLQLQSSEGFSGGDSWVPLDETVDPGRSWQIVSGLEWEPSGVYRLTAESYYTDLANLVLFDEEAEENREQSTSEEVFKTGGEGYATGLELFAEKRRGKLTGWLGYTLGFTRRTFPEVDEGRSFPPKYDRRHNLSMTTVYRFKPVCPTCGRWSLNANFVYGTGQAFTPAAARYTLRDPAIDRPVDRLLGARRNTARLMPYHRLDIGFRRTLKMFGGGVDAEVYVQVFNFYNRRNEWFVEYDARDSSRKPNVVPMLPVLPTFGFDFRF